MSEAVRKTLKFHAFLKIRRGREISVQRPKVSGIRKQKDGPDSRDKITRWSIVV